MEEQLNNDAPFTSEGGSSNKGIKPSGVSQKSWEMYNHFYDYAKGKGDLHPEVFASQAALESNWFNKINGKNNYFGKQATKSEPHTNIGGTKYRDYNNLDDALLDRFNNYSSKYQTLPTSREAVNKLSGYPSNKNYNIELNDLMDSMNINIDTPKTQYEEPIAEEPINNIEQQIPNQDLQQNVPEETIPELDPQQSQLVPDFSQQQFNYNTDLKASTDNNLELANNNSVKNLKNNNPIRPYAEGGVINPPSKTKPKDQRTPTSSLVINPIEELGHTIKRTIPVNEGPIPYSKSTDPEYNNSRKDFVDWYSNPVTQAKFEKNTNYDPARLKDLISKGTAIKAFKSTAQKQPPVGSKAVFNTPDVTGKEEEILYHPGVGNGVIQHELTHASALANILGPALLRATGSPKNQKLPSDINDPNFKSTSNSIRDYMSIPSEAYGNFHEFRIKLGLKPGDQINKDQLRKLVKEKNLGQENFFNTFEDDNIVNAINTVADNNPNRNQYQAAYGGSIGKANSTSNSLNEFNKGGTHEQNPLGGIPQGISANGKMNTVEQGETSHMIDGKKFIFSNRILI